MPDAQESLKIDPAGPAKPNKPVTATAREATTCGPRDLSPEEIAARKIAAMEAKAIALGNSPWVDLDDKAKIERLRNVVKQLDRTLAQALQALQELRHHQHSAQGHVLVAPSRGYGHTPEGAGAGPIGDDEHAWV